jgi:hypothetical protein
MAAVSLWDFEHEGSPDYDDVDDVAALGGDAPLKTQNPNHPLMISTPWANWEEIEGADPDVDPSTFTIGQSWWDLWCLEGCTSQWLQGRTNALRYSVLPSAGGEVFEALVSVGGLELGYRVSSAQKFLSMIRAAAAESAKDDRINLRKEDFFKHQGNVDGSRPVASHAFAYAITGASIIESCEDCSCLGRLGFAVRPRLLSTDRNGAGNCYLKVLDAIRSLTGVRSDFFKEVVSKPTAVNALEVAEMLVNTWQLLHNHSPNLYTGARPVSRAMEMELSARLAFGTDVQRGAAFTESFKSILEPHPRIRKVIGMSEGTMSEVIGRFEHVAVLLVPGARWDTVACAAAVEVRLAEWMPLVSSLGDLSGVEVIERLRKAVSLQPGGGGNGRGAEAGAIEGGKGGVGASGQEALKLQTFLDAAVEITEILDAEEPNVMALFDTLLDSGNKLLYMLATQQLTKKTGNQVIQDCSPFMSEFSLYWAQCLGDGVEEAEKRLQGKRVDGYGMESLLAGDWHLVPWVLICSDLARWVDGTKEGISENLHDFETLTRVQAVQISTFKMMRLDMHSTGTGTTNSSSEGSEANSGASRSHASPGRRTGSQAGSAQRVSYDSLFKRILRLQAKSGMMPAGSKPRLNHEHNVRSILCLMLKAAGQRWHRQFAGEVNYTAVLQTCFLTDSSYVLNELEKMEKVAGQLYEYKETLPALLGSWEEPGSDVLVDLEMEIGAGKVADKTRPNPPPKEGQLG